jgi:curved DNA-binding protein CbpA
MNSKQKYFKYKAKYLELKNNLIGADMADVEKILSADESKYEEVLEELYGNKINFENRNEIEIACRKISPKIHPDKNGNEPIAGKAFTKLNDIIRIKLIEKIGKREQAHLTPMGAEQMRLDEIYFEKMRARDEQDKANRDRKAQENATQSAAQKKLDEERQKREKLEKEEEERQRLERKFGGVDRKKRIDKDDIKRYINYRRTADTIIIDDTYILEQIYFLVNHKDVSDRLDVEKLVKVAQEIMTNYDTSSNKYANKLVNRIIIASLGKSYTT